ncbi:MAG: T9SS type A sorting domain-containing protein [Bacteroidales bacterium]|nr:T9SS type A sorting domain-containing protein [Bacteroidales bacterium]
MRPLKAIILVILLIIPSGLFAQSNEYNDIIAAVTGCKSPNDITNTTNSDSFIDSEPDLTSYLAGTTCTISPASTTICPGTSITINYTTSNVWTGSYAGTAQYSTNGGGSWTTMTPNTTNGFSYSPTSATSYCVRVLNNDGSVACGPTCTTISVYSVSSSTPTLTAPANYAYLYSPSVTFTWTHTTGTHPNSRYEIQIDGGSWISTGIAKTYIATVAAGSHTWRVRYYEGCSGNYYTAIARTFYYYSSTTCGDVDHLGQNWTIASDVTLQGRHYNVGTFTVNSGVTVSVNSSCHYFNVEATSIYVYGTINGNGAGGLGGSGGAGGAFSDCDNVSATKGIAGGNGSSPSTGAGTGGTNGTDGQSEDNSCWDFENDYHSGAGGAGSGSGGSYGGSGGYGSWGAAGLGYDGGPYGGTYGNGNAAGAAYGSASDLAISYGSGGGGGGGAGGGYQYGSDGGSGGAGGGQIKLVSSGNFTMGASAALHCNGMNGNVGGSAGYDVEFGWDCGCLWSPDDWELNGGAGGGAGGGSGGGILIQACGTINIPTGSTISTIGGNGGAAGEPDPGDGDFDYATGGGGGGGGRVKIVRNPCETYTNNATVSVNGGNGGTYYYGNGNSGSSGTFTSDINHPNYIPLTGGTVAGDQTVCTGANPNAFTNSVTPTGGNCTGSKTYQWLSCTTSCGSPPTGYSTIGGATSLTYDPPAPLTTTTYYVRRVTSGSCVAYSNILTVTVVPDPVSPTATKSPDVAEVCAGQTLTLTGVTDNGGGAGSCSIQYCYSTNGSTFTSWSTSLPSFAAVAGSNNIIKIRKSCTGLGCDISAENSYTWSVVPDPTLSAATRTNSIICQGGSTVYTSSLSNGTGTVTYQWQYSADGSAYSNVATGTPTGAVYTNPATTSMTVSGITAVSTFYYRLSATIDGSGCTNPVTSAGATVQVVADPSLSAATQTNSIICQGGSTIYSSNLTGGTGTVAYQWQYSADGITYSNVATGTPTGATYTNATSATMTIGGISAIGTYYYQLYATIAGNGCTSPVTSASATVQVVADPSLTAASRTNSIICQGGSSVYSSSLSNGTGTFTYQWQYSPNNSSWSNVITGTPAGAAYTNPTTTSMTVSGITVTSTYYYRLSATTTGNGCTSPIYSLSASVQVVADPSDPSATKSPNTSNVCVGDILTLTGVTDNGGGTGTCNIEYCYSTNAGNTYSSWSTSLPSFAATGTDNRIKIRKNCNGIGCDISPENTYIWSVDATSVSGTASSNPASEICAGTTALLSLTGNTGNIQWQTNSSGTWQNIAGATNSTYTTPQLSKTTSYRAIVTSGVCSSVTSNVISVAVTIPSTSGIISNDYIWTGAINTAWDGSTNGNWIKFSGSDFEVPASVPTEASNVFIRSSGSCFTATPSVSTVNVAKCNKLTIDNGNSLNINSGGNLTVNGDFTNSGTVTMNSSSTLYAKGKWVNDGTFNAGSGTVIFNGSSNQEIQSGASLFNNVTFNNTATGVTDLNISESMIINGSAIFTNGVLYFTGTGSLSFTSNASSDIGTANSYVDGQVTKSGTGAFTFPVGEGIVWAPVGIAAPSNNSTITAEYNFTEGPYNWSAAYMCDESQLHHTSGVEHWVLTTTNSTPAVTLYWYSGSRSGITDLTDLAVAHYTGSCWEYKAGSLSGDLTSGTITSTISFSSYSPVSFGSKRGINPLPVELTSFDAKCTGTGVLLTWQTASESNNSKFTIERSEDGSYWNIAASVDGAGNSITLKNYYYTDKIVSDSILYYRLSQTDFDGVSKYSAVVSVFCKDAATEPGIFIYPNPFNNSLNIKVENWDSDVFIAEMYDVTGKKIGEWQEANAPVDFTKEINIKGLAPGMYTIKITTAEKIIVRKVEKE